MFLLYFYHFSLVLLEESRSLFELKLEIKVTGMDN
jgi:hypothetical protein